MYICNKPQNLRIISRNYFYHISISPDFQYFARNRQASSNLQKGSIIFHRSLLKREAARWPLLFLVAGRCHPFTPPQTPPSGRGFVGLRTGLRRSRWCAHLLLPKLIGAAGVPLLRTPAAKTIGKRYWSPLFWDTCSTYRHFQVLKKDRYFFTIFAVS